MKQNIIIGLIVVIGVILVLKAPAIERRLGSGLSGVTATYASSTNVTLTTKASGRLTASSTCSARIISTNNGAIYLTFNDTTATGNDVFHASGTVAYHQEDFGCGEINGFSPLTQSINVVEYR